MWWLVLELMGDVLLIGDCALNLATGKHLNHACLLYIFGRVPMRTDYKMLTFLIYIPTDKAVDRFPQIFLSENIWHVSWLPSRPLKNVGLHISLCPPV